MDVCTLPVIIFAAGNRTYVRNPLVLSEPVSCPRRSGAAQSGTVPMARCPEVPPPTTSPPFSVAHPGASAANSSSLKMLRKVSPICACNASVRSFVAGRTFNQWKNGERPASAFWEGVRTGSGDRRRIVLICPLHLFLERREARSLGSHAPKKNGEASTPDSCHVGFCAHAYLDFFRFWNWERLDKVFDLFSLHHEVFH